MRCVSNLQKIFTSAECRAVGALPSDSLLGILPGVHVALVNKLQTTLVASDDLHVVGILSTLYYNIRERVIRE